MELPVFVRVTVNDVLSPRSIEVGPLIATEPCGVGGGVAGAVTVNVAGLLVIPSWDAVMFAVPSRIPLANPDPVIVATAVSVLDQVAVVVTSLVVLSLNVPIAVNCWVCPSSIEGLPGVTEMDVNVGGCGGAVTVNVAGLLVTPSWDAVMFVAPATTPLANPDPVIVATAVSVLDQVAVVVRSTVLLSLNVPDRRELLGLPLFYRGTPGCH